MNTLEKIIQHKQSEVTERKSLYPTRFLERSLYFDSVPVSLCKYLKRPDKTGIIAEIKRHSPSLGYINKYLNVEKTSIGYMQAGASALSVLTDTEFFKGTSDDLGIARKFNFCPILRKVFIVDEYQVIESKSIGADVILLIAAALTKKQIITYTDLAQSLGMEVLIEIHSEEELSKVYDKANAIGVNNRDLKTLKIDVEQSKRLAPLLPPGAVKVSESGIENPDTIIELKSYGYEGFLIGTGFMKYPRPEEACREFVNRLKEKEKSLISA